MEKLRQLQQGFLAHLLDSQSKNGGSSLIAEQIESTQSLSAQGRLNIYAHAYSARLKKALASDYEKLNVYLGDQQFDQLLDLYIQRFPSRQISLRFYGMHMATLLCEEQPYSDLPVLAEIATIEAALMDSFDAADGMAVSIEDIAQVQPESWHTLSFELQASAKVLALDLNSFAIWKALKDEVTPPEAVPTEYPEHWLLWRDQNLITRYRPLPIHEMAMIRLAQKGKAFPTLCEALLDYFDEADVPAKAIGLLQSWLKEDLIKSLSTEI